MPKNRPHVGVVKKHGDDYYFEDELGNKGGISPKAPDSGPNQGKKWKGTVGWQIPASENGKPSGTLTIKIQGVTLVLEHGKQPVIQVNGVTCWIEEDAVLFQLDQPDPGNARRYELEYDADFKLPSDEGSKNIRSYDVALAGPVDSPPKVFIP